MQPEVVTHNGLTLDLSQIKCIIHGDYFDGKKTQMIVVFKTRYEFIYHPEKDKFIKNSTIVFAHLPKKLKAKLNPTGK